MSPSPFSEPPRWGAFPSEQYLLQNWDSESEETDAEQRRRLIREFIQIDVIPEEWDTVLDEERRDEEMVVQPSEEQISTILAPWRSPSLRLTAANIGCSVPMDRLIWLRTHYDKDEAARARDDKNLREWMKTALLYQPNPDCDDFEEAWSWLLLNNDQVFDFGDDWSAVFDIVPEILGPFRGVADESRALPCDPDSDSTWSGILATCRERLREDLELREGREERAAWVDRESEIKTLCVRTALLVVDERTFATGLLRIVFVDPKGNEVRTTRSMYDGNWWTIKADLCGGGLETNDWFAYDDADENDTEEWHDGEKYRAGGEIGKVLYGVQDMLEEQ